jgi:hypothetical protein
VQLKDPERHPLPSALFVTASDQEQERVIVKHFIDPKSQDDVDCIEYAMNNLAALGISRTEVDGGKVLQVLNVCIGEIDNTAVLVKLASGRVVGTWVNGHPPVLLTKAHIQAVLDKLAALAQRMLNAQGLLPD